MKKVLFLMGCLWAILTPRFADAQCSNGQFPPTFTLPPNNDACFENLFINVSINPIDPLLPFESYFLNITGSDGSFSSNFVDNSGFGFAFHTFSPNLTAGPVAVTLSYDIVCASDGSILFSGGGGAGAVFNVYPPILDQVLSLPDCAGNNGQVQLVNANDPSVVIAGPIDAGIAGTNTCGSSPHVIYNLTAFPGTTCEQTITQDYFLDPCVPCCATLADNSAVNVDEYYCGLGFFNSFVSLDIPSNGYTANVYSSNSGLVASGTGLGNDNNIYFNYFSFSGCQTVSNDYFVRVICNSSGAQIGADIPLGTKTVYVDYSGMTYTLTDNGCGNPPTVNFVNNFGQFCTPTEVDNTIIAVTPIEGCPPTDGSYHYRFQGEDFNDPNNPCPYEVVLDGVIIGCISACPGCANIVSITPDASSYCSGSTANICVTFDGPADNITVEGVSVNNPGDNVICVDILMPLNETCSMNPQQNFPLNIICNNAGGFPIGNGGFVTDIYPAPFTVNQITPVDCNDGAAPYYEFLSADGNSCNATFGVAGASGTDCSNSVTEQIIYSNTYFPNAPDACKSEFNINDYSSCNPSCPTVCCGASCFAFNTVTINSITPEVCYNSNGQVNIALSVDQDLYISMYDPTFNVYGTVFHNVGDPLSYNIDFTNFNSGCDPIIVSDLIVTVFCPINFNILESFTVNSLTSTLYPGGKTLSVVNSPSCDGSVPEAHVLAADLFTVCESIFGTPATVSCPANTASLDQSYAYNTGTICETILTINQTTQCSNCCPLVTSFDPLPVSACDGEVVNICAYFDSPFVADGDVIINGVAAVAGQTSICFDYTIQYDTDPIGGLCTEKFSLQEVDILCNIDNTINTASIGSTNVFPPASNWSYLLFSGQCGNPPLFFSSGFCPLVATSLVPDPINPPIDGCPPSSGEYQIQLEYLNDFFTPFVPPASCIADFPTNVTAPILGCNSCGFCPTATYSYSDLTVCSGGSFTLTVTFDDPNAAIGSIIQVFSFDNSINIIETVTSLPASAPYTYEIVFNAPANTTCNDIIEGINLSILCYDLISTIIFATDQLVINPEIQDPIVTYANCEVEVAPFCSNQVMTASAPTGGAAIANFDATTGIYTPLPGDAAGTLTITVSGVAGSLCNSVDVVITTPATLSLSANINQILCNGGTGDIDVTVSGGASPITFLWDDAAASTTEDLSSLSPGIYTIIATDNNGCTATGTYTIDPEPAALVANVGNYIEVCNGASANVNASAIGGIATGGVNTTTEGYQYAWMPTTGLDNASIANPLATPTVTTTYTLTVIDDNNCIDTAQLLVIVNPLPVISAMVTDVTCFGLDNGSIDATIANGTAPFNYTWSNAAITEDISSLAPNTYILEVFDDNNCYDSIHVIVSEPALLTVTSTDNDILCNGGTGSIDVTVSGGISPYDIDWTDPSIPDQTNVTTITSATGLNANSYTAIITDANGCTVNINETIDEPSLLTASTSNIDIPCPGGTGTISVVVNGGTSPYDINWADPTITDQTNVLSIASVTISAGVYNATITDANNCTVDISENVVVLSTLSLNAGTTQTICEGNSVTLNAVASGGVTTGGIVLATEGYQYVWSPSAGLSSTTIANPIASPAISTLYNVTVTDDDNCSITMSVQVNVNINPIANAVTLSQCVASGSNATFNLAEAFDGIGTDADNGAVGMLVSIHNSLLDAQGNISPLASLTYSGASTTLYVRIEDAITGCYATAPLTLVVSTNPSAPTVSTPITYCLAESASALSAVSPGNNISWYMGNTFASAVFIGSIAPVPNTSATGSTTYWAVATSLSGCSSSASQIIVNIENCANPINLTIADPCMCMDNATIGDMTGESGQYSEVITITGGNGPYTLVWGTGVYEPTFVYNISNVVNTPAPTTLVADIDGITDLQVKFNSGGNYTLTVIDATGQSAFIIGGGCQYPSMTLEPEPPACEGATINLLAYTTDAVSVVWSNIGTTIGTGNLINYTLPASAIIGSSINVSATATGADGCSVSGNMDIALECIMTTISGTVFYTEDLNGNGVLDPGEDQNGDGVLNTNVPIANAWVTLTFPDGSFQVVQTDAFGNYIFTDVPSENGNDYNITINALGYDVVPYSSSNIGVFNLLSSGSINNNFILSNGIAVALGWVNLEIENNCKATELKWNAQSTSTIAEYEIWKSNNGLQWIKLKTIDGNVNTFIDDSNFEQNTYYKIVAIAADNDILTSNIQIASRKCNDDYSYNLYPNPTSHTAWLQLMLNEPSLVQISLIDILGRKHVLHNTQCNIGNNNLLLPIENFASAIYFVEIQVNGKTSFIKLEKVD